MSVSDPVGHRPPPPENNPASAGFRGDLSPRSARTILGSHVIGGRRSNGQNSPRTASTKCFMRLRACPPGTGPGLRRGRPARGRQAARICDGLRPTINKVCGSGMKADHAGRTTIINAGLRRDCAVRRRHGEA